MFAIITNIFLVTLIRANINLFTQKLGMFIHAKWGEKWGGGWRKKSFKIIREFFPLL